MRLFINDFPVDIISLGDEGTLHNYDVIINGGDKKIDTATLLDDVLIRNASKKQITTLLELMQKKRLKNLDTITFAVEDQKSIKKFVKSKFKIVEAAGGIVEKGDRLLLIYRNDKWDLPKGKMEPKESKKECAVREVEEECNVKVNIDKKVCTTWHTYTRNGKNILKKTYWYKMYCLDDQKMKPQRKEGIEEVRWLTHAEVRQNLYASYRSIRYIFQSYYHLDN